MKQGIKFILLLMIAFQCLILSEAKAITVIEEEAIDKRLGFFDEVWTISLPSLYSKQDLPVQMKTIHSPFLQQVNRSADPRVQGLGDDLCLQPGPPVPPFPPGLPPNPPIDVCAD